MEQSTEYKALKEVLFSHNLSGNELSQKMSKAVDKFEEEIEVNVRYFESFGANPKLYINAKYSEFKDWNEKVKDSVNDFSAQKLSADLMGNQKELERLEKQQQAINNQSDKTLWIDNLLYTFKTEYGTYLEIPNKTNKFTETSKENSQSNQFEILEKCVRLTGYCIHSDKKVIDELNHQEYEHSIILETFKNELNKNLLSAQTQQGMVNIVKYYIFKFYELQGFYKYHNDILFIGSLRNYTSSKFEHTNELGEKRKLSDFENYVVNSHELFDMLFNEIQVCCHKYQIDFFKLCEELHFSFEYFDSGITLGFIKKSNDTLTAKPPPPSTFADIFTNEDWEKYISAFEKTDPILINSNKEFVGKPRPHKGVVCSWFDYLKQKGIIKQSVNRSQLAFVLNQEIINLNLGKDGKIFDLESNEYKNKFEKQLIELTS